MSRKIRSERGELIKKRIFGEFGVFTFALPKIAEEVMPGQFIMLKIKDEKDPLLSRPFSVFHAEDKVLELFVKRVGRTTSELFALNTGEKVNFLGPLGNTFKKTGSSVVLIGGGSGVAPLNFYARKYGFGRFLIGFPSYLEGLSGIFPDGVDIVTEDGSFGKKGYPTDYLNGDEGIVYACGPLPMLRSLEKKRSKSLENTYVSLESMMGCGFGICAGCGVKKRKEEGYFRVCSDGPIFSFSRIAV